MSNKKVKGKSRKNKRRTRFCLFVFVTAFFVMLFVSLAAIVLSAYAENIITSFDRTNYRYQLGGDDLADTVIRRVNLEDMYHAGQLYLCMDDVAALCDLTVTGDHTRRTYFPVDDPGETITFFFSSEQAEVNGSSYRMYGEMFEQNGKIYVPASVIIQFFDGFNVVVDPLDARARSIKLFRTSLGVEYNVLDEEIQIYAPIRFLAGKSSAIEPIKQGSVFIYSTPQIPTDPTPVE